jgi:hypothetical protein
MRLTVRHLLVYAGFLFLLICPLTNKVNAGVTFNDGFESGSIGPYGKEICCDYSATVVTSPVRSGKYAVRFESRPGTKRSEINPQGNSGHAGDERWFAYSIYLPKEWLTDPNEAIVTQWHERPDSCENWRTPPLTMAIAKGNLRFTRKWDTRACTSGGPQGQKVFYLKPLETDRWLDFVVHVKWSYKDDGLVEVWKNGEKIITEPGPNAYNDQRDHYIKIGMYNFDGISRTRVLYYDNIKIGDANTKYEDIAIGGSGPVEQTALISLKSGWNLISLPLQPKESAIEKLLSGISNKYAAVHAYDGSKYLSYVPGATNNTLSSLETGLGYWVFMNEAATLEIKGNAAAKSINLKQHWNLVGYSSTTSAQIGTALASISGKYLAIYAFDNASNSYKGYVPGTGGDLQTLEPGQGYWIYASENVTWTLP